jgi:hypothetical protein
MQGNAKNYPFNATTTAQTIIPANPRRRMLIYQSYGVPDLNSPVTVWIDDTGNDAVPYQCTQLVGGVTLPSLPWPFCPTGAISVVTQAGTQLGVIQEFLL